jgi:hypothetical protein
MTVSKVLYTLAGEPLRGPRLQPVKPTGKSGPNWMLVLKCAVQTYIATDRGPNCDVHLA